MKRQIYVVHASIVDANGTFNVLDGYPKVFRSESYDNDIDITKKRADGAFSECYGAMCKRDDRQLQTVILMTADGFVVEEKHLGAIADLPDPEEAEETTE